MRDESGWLGSGSGPTVSCLATDTDLENSRLELRHLSGLDPVRIHSDLDFARQWISYLRTCGQGFGGQRVIGAKTSAVRADFSPRKPYLNIGGRARELLGLKSPGCLKSSSLCFFSLKY